MQACLAWWSTVSPYGGFGSTAALVFVLLVAGIKAVYEDFKRHNEDKETNNSVTHVMQPDGGCLFVCVWVFSHRTFSLCPGASQQVAKAPAPAEFSALQT